ncbi:MAG: hypothetical protein Q7J16_07550 [Candidatus Cloacimonadales bacterium]|nr:hypothetical protein [Candidatus Cloacimonadales bacterium]
MSEFDLQVKRKLEKIFTEANLLRKMRITRYDAGMELVYDVQSLDDKKSGKIKIRLDKFVGGGFAGQVYKVILLENKQNLNFLEIGKTYAIKILIPPSGFSKLFRDAVYWLGFQGPFQLQVNPAASRAGALWQKFIRRAAKLRFGNENSIVDIYATFIDETLGSCGEISEWVEGRTWQLEVENHMDILQKWNRHKQVDESKLNSIEYRTKKIFMKEFVQLLNEMGGYEFARQYEWSTCKSQPNCLKRDKTPPDSGLVAVDFRAGLALLPFLPMSPGDFKLIGKGILRGSLVQFDHGSLKKLAAFMEKNKTEFADIKDQFQELTEMEDIYRNSVPDITHNHFRLLFSGKLWKTMLSSAVTGWKIKNLITSETEVNWQKNKFLTFWLFLIGIIPILGKYFIKFCGNKPWRKHYLKIIYNWKYLSRTVKASAAEKAINWYRQNRILEAVALKIPGNFFLFLGHLILSILPSGLHKFVTDFTYFKESLWFIFVRPIRLYFDTKLREEWLMSMLAEGKKKHILSDDDAMTIESQLNEPFIQKYLKSLAVHICTLPITQVVSVAIAVIYVITHPEMPKTQSWGIGVGIIALFQVIPISPGSLTRGLYVLYLVIKEKDFKNYNIAVFLGFFKYIGYLAFPIQMTYKYPALARFMAGHWATEAVHIVPVFGEGGALLEHWIFGLFYNWPLTIRGQMNRRMELRKRQKSRLWPVPIFIIIFSALFIGSDYYFLHSEQQMMEIKQVWWLGMFLPFLLGSLITRTAGGMILWKRITSAAISAISVSIIYTIYSWQLGFAGHIFPEFVWRFFIFAVFSILGVVLTELNLGDPEKN